MFKNILKFELYSVGKGLNALKKFQELNMKKVVMSIALAGLLTSLSAADFAAQDAEFLLEQTTLMLSL